MPTLRGERRYKHHKHASLDVEVDFWRFSPHGDGAVAVPAQLRPILGAADVGKGDGRGGRGRSETRGAADGRGKGKGRGKGGGAGHHVKSKQEARAHAAARLAHYGGGKSGNKGESHKRGDGVRVTKLG
jgi:hypothetical protein